MQNDIQPCFCEKKPVEMTESKTRLGGQKPPSNTPRPAPPRGSKQKYEDYLELCRARGFETVECGKCGGTKVRRK